MNCFLLRVKKQSLTVVFSFPTSSSYTGPLKLALRPKFMSNLGNWRGISKLKETVYTKKLTNTAAKTEKEHGTLFDGAPPMFEPIQSLRPVSTTPTKCISPEKKNSYLNNVKCGCKQCGRRFSFDAGMSISFL